jgi:hypothetical protein
MPPLFSTPPLLTMSLLLAVPRKFAHECNARS